MLTIFPENLTLDAWMGSNYASGIYLNFLSWNCKIISPNKVFSKGNFTKLSVSNSKSKSVTKLEAHSFKNDILNKFLPSCKKFCWKTSRDNLLKFLGILIENALFRYFQLKYFKKLNKLIIFKSGTNFNSIQYIQVWLNIALMLLLSFLLTMDLSCTSSFIILSCRVNMYAFKKQWNL